MLFKHMPPGSRNTPREAGRHAHGCLLLVAVKFLEDAPEPASTPRRLRLERVRRKPISSRGGDTQRYAGLRSLKLPSSEAEEWFRTTLSAAFADVTTLRRQQAQVLRKRQTEVAGMQDRLLTAYLAGTVDESLFREKSEALKGQAEDVRRSLEQSAEPGAGCGERALEAFDWSQQGADRWSISNSEARRRILDDVSLKRTLSDVSLCVEKRKPFDALAERPSFGFGRGEWI